jgi:hypothetical protein
MQKYYQLSLKKHMQLSRAFVFLRNFNIKIHNLTAMHKRLPTMDTNWKSIPWTTQINLLRSKSSHPKSPIKWLKTIYFYLTMLSRRANFGLGYKIVSYTPSHAKINQRGHKLDQKSTTLFSPKIPTRQAINILFNKGLHTWILVKICLDRLKLIISHS